MRKNLSIYKQKINKTPVGYCHCRAHKGALTVQLMKKHCCLRKNCPMLQKNDEHPYWETRALKKLAAKQAKQEFNQRIYG